MFQNEVPFYINNDPGDDKKNKMAPFCYKHKA